jgi:Pyridoxamine 5'-phosphate oxidase
VPVDRLSAANRDSMGKSFAALQSQHNELIARQRVFFIASAAARARVNISPKPTDALRIIDTRSVVYMDLTGSGNETAAHLLADGRLTFMFCAFEGPPAILRLFGTGRVLGRDSEAYQALLAARFGGAEPAGTRQMVRLDIELVRSSCGYGVPLFDYAGERDTLRRWASAKGEAGLHEYRLGHNRKSIDGLPTGFHDEDHAAGLHEPR